MITEQQLNDLDFYKDEYNEDSYSGKNHDIGLEDGVITFIRENSNFHGLHIQINSIYEFAAFLAFIKK